MNIPEELYLNVAAQVDPVNPERTAANPSFRAAVNGAIVEYVALVNLRAAFPVMQQVGIVTTNSS